MKVVFKIVQVIIHTLNVIVHSIGSYALITLYRTSRQKTQRIYLINLSICEGLYNVLEAARAIHKLITYTNHVNPFVHKIMQYVNIISYTGMTIGCYFAMTYITVDRLLHTILNLKYPLYWNETKAKYHMIATSIFGFILCLSVSLIFSFTGFDWNSIFFKYVYTRRWIFQLF